ncbi:hypothetical protein [Hyphomicrobium sp. D-2]|uniref:hypothetical protein n=1 Tax=Hyphomicrobium sp. D-2 TaxID=3041621 RepID=UPI00245702C7|nr:hypothetical protein [Hyphomicrobium sp. D-2]MDH4982306.1 hypothetical protein [Hyphomicrobium sp. D-2]
MKWVRPMPPPPPPVARWEELGCSKAGFLPNKDVIRAGRREGRFSQIQLRAFRNKVHILNLRVIHGNGAPDDIPVKSEIRDGGEDRPLDLKGNRTLHRQRRAVLCGAAEPAEGYGPGLRLRTLMRTD